MVSARASPWVDKVRLAAGRSIVQLDCGTVPKDEFSTQAHAGFLAFELSSGPYRLVVNCGSGSQSHPNWVEPLRATPAHSTVVLGETSSGEITGPGWVRNWLGPRLTGGPARPESRRSETESYAQGACENEITRCPGTRQQA